MDKPVDHMNLREQAIVATVLAGLLEVVNTSLLKTDSASVMAEYILQFVEGTGLLGEEVNA